MEDGEHDHNIIINNLQMKSFSVTLPCVTCIMEWFRASFVLCKWDALICGAGRKQSGTIVETMGQMEESLVSANSTKNLAKEKVAGLDASIAERKEEVQ